MSAYYRLAKACATVCVAVNSIPAEVFYDANSTISLAKARLVLGSKRRATADPDDYPEHRVVLAAQLAMEGEGRDAEITRFFLFRLLFSIFFLNLK